MNISNIQVSTGNWRNSLGEINHSYREAEKILSFGKTSKIKSGVYSYYNWEILLSMLPLYLHDLFQDDVSIRLKPLMENTSFPELARTFVEYCHSNMNISKACQEIVYSSKHAHLSIAKDRSTNILRYKIIWR